MVHDTALQETGTFTFFTALSIFAILRARTSQSVWPAAGAGVALEYRDSEEAAQSALSPDDQRQLNLIGSSPRRRNDWDEHCAYSWMRFHTLDVVSGALRKVSAGFSWRRRLYFVFFTHDPLRSGRPFLDRLSMAGDAAHLAARCLFIAVTAVFRAHTSHRAYLDVYGIVFAAYVLISTYGTLPLRPFRLGSKARTPHNE